MILVLRGGWFLRFEHERGRSAKKKIKEILNSVAFRFLLYVIHTPEIYVSFDLSKKKKKQFGICDRNTH